VLYCHRAFDLTLLAYTPRYLHVFTPTRLHTSVFKPARFDPYTARIHIPMFTTSIPRCPRHTPLQVYKLPHLHASMRSYSYVGIHTPSNKSPYFHVYMQAYTSTCPCLEERSYKRSFDFPLVSCEYHVHSRLNTFLAAFRCPTSPPTIFSPSSPPRFPRSKPLWSLLPPLELFFLSFLPSRALDRPMNHLQSLLPPSEPFNSTASIQSKTFGTVSPELSISRPCCHL
jgi:hypothetical protein